MYDINTSNASDYNFGLSDGTPVEFVKITTKDNIQVRLPADHADAQDPLRIFRRDGSHSKDNLDVTLNAIRKPAIDTTPAPVAAPAPVDASNDDGTGDLIVRDGKVFRLVLVGALAA